MGKRWVWIALAMAAVVAAIAIGFRSSRHGSDESAATPALSASAPSRVARRTSTQLGPRQSVVLGGASVVSIDETTIGRLEGHVISAGTGDPIPGAELVFWGPRGEVSVSSSPTGAFRLEPAAEGIHELWLAEAEGYFPISVESGDSPLFFTARRGSSVQGATIVLTPTVEYRGRVLTARGEPVADALVEVREPAQTDTWTTDAQGEFDFHARDGAILEASHPIAGRGRGQVGFAVQASHSLTIVVSPDAEPAQARITGRVVDHEGEPVPDVLVSAAFEPPPKARESKLVTPGATDRTDADGHFSLERLDPGAYTVMASTPDFAPAIERGVVAPAEGITLVVASGVRITGRVTDATSGEPVTSFVIVVSEKTGPLEAQTILSESTYDAEGEYETQEVTAGTYLVTASAAGYALSRDRDVIVGSEPVVVDFQLERGGSIAGFVRDAGSNEPIAAAKVSLEHRLGFGPASVPLVASALTDDKGAFLLRGVEAGPKSLLASAAGHHGRVASGIVVPANGSVGPIEIALTPTEPGEEPKIELAGIGAVLAAEADALVIQRLVDGGGADEAGLEVGDEIVAVEGTAVVDLGFQAAIERIRGPEGSTVELEVRRGGAAQAEVVQVVRRKVKA